MKFELYKIFSRKMTLALIAVFLLITLIFVLGSLRTGFYRNWSIEENCRQHIAFTLNTIEETGNLGEFEEGSWLYRSGRFVEFQADINSPVIQKIISMYRQVEIPQEIETANEGWAHIFNYLEILLWFVGLIIIFGAAPVFAEERSTGADKILLTAKHGTKKVIVNKILAALLFSLTVYILFLAVHIVPRIMFYGLSGLHDPIQVNIHFTQSPYDYTMLTLLLNYVAVGIMTSLFLCMTGLALSAVSRNSFIAVIPSLIIFIFSVFDGFLSLSVHLYRLLTLFPASVYFGAAEPWQQPDFYNIFGLLIDRPTMIIIFSAAGVCVLAALCFLTTRRMEASN